MAVDILEKLRKKGRNAAKGTVLRRIGFEATILLAECFADGVGFVELLTKTISGPEKDKISTKEAYSETYWRDLKKMDLTKLWRGVREAAEIYWKEELSNSFQHLAPKYRI